MRSPSLRAATWSLTCENTPATSLLPAASARKGSREKLIWGDTGKASTPALSKSCRQVPARVLLLPCSHPPSTDTLMKTMQKAVTMWPPLMFLSSSICPQMSQRVVILRTIAGHPFQCLLPSQFDDIHLWGRIIAFSTCITVIAPLCTTQSISPEYQNENVVFAASQSYWEFCWKLKQKRIIAHIDIAVKNQPKPFLFLVDYVRLHAQYSWHYCSCRHQETKEIYKDCSASS